jgi:hypothetical protein
MPTRLARDYERVLEVADYCFSSGKAGYVQNLRLNFLI